MRVQNCEELRRLREMVRKAGFCGVVNFGVGCNRANGFLVPDFEGFYKSLGKDHFGHVCIKRGKCERLFEY